MDIVFDIDGTLADASHRLPHITNPEEPKNWDAFFAGVVDDKPIPEAWAILNALLIQGHHAIFITGRPERVRRKTEGWLTAGDCKHRNFLGFASRYGVHGPGDFALKVYMRSDGDLRPSHNVKRDLLRKARLDNFNPKVAFEDRAADAQMWRDEGLLCCHVNEGAF